MKKLIAKLAEAVKPVAIRLKREKIGKFLGTFANVDATWSNVAKGVNDMAPIIVEYELQAALSSGDTLTVSPPTGMDKDYVPIAYKCWTNATPALLVSQPETANSLKLTSHNRTTGETIFTAGSAGVADNSVLSVMYVPATAGT